MPKVKASKKNSLEINKEMNNLDTLEMNNLENQKQTISLQDNSEPEQLIPEYEKISELKTVTETIEPEPEPKKKRGRPKKSEVIETPELSNIDLSPIANILVKRLPNPIELSDMEKQLFNETANKVFQKYGGSFKYIEEVNFGLVLVSILYPRLQKNQSDKNEA